MHSLKTETGNAPCFQSEKPFYQEQIHRVILNYFGWVGTHRNIFALKTRKISKLITLPRQWIASLPSLLSSELIFYKNLNNLTLVWNVAVNILL